MAVVHDLKIATLTQALQQHFFHSVHFIEGIEAGSINSNYKLTAERDEEHGTFVLTLFAPSLSAGALATYTALLPYLNQQALCVPALLSSQVTGNVLIEIEGIPAVVQTFIEGTHPTLRADSPEARLPHLEAAAAFLGKLHCVPVPNHFTQENPYHLKAVKHFLEHVHTHAPQQADHLERRAMARICQQISSLLEEDASAPHASVHPLPRAICHTDLFPDNLLFSGAQLEGVLDWWLACEETALYDICVFLNAWCWDELNQTVNMPRFQAALLAYQTERLISAHEMNALYKELTRAALTFTTMRLMNAVEGKPAHVLEAKPVQPWFNRLCYWATKAFPEENFHFPA